MDEPDEKDLIKKLEKIKVDKEVLNEKYAPIDYTRGKASQDIEDKNLNLVIIGHVDSGKSTLTGHLLMKLGDKQH